MARMDERAVSPVVAKTLAASLALLYVAGMTSMLLGGVVPSYEAETGAELSERVLATAAKTVETAVPDADGTVQATRSVELPPTIRDTSYRLELSNGTLQFDHPDDRLDESIALSLPAGTTLEPGTWTSGGEFEIRVSGPGSNRTVTLEQ
ncbi:MAG: hypothetical protein V5A52_05180 [Halovenus sp.]